MPTAGDIATVVSAAGTIGALIVAFIVYRGQAKLSRDIAQAQEQLLQRQLLVPLWQYLSAIPDIRPEQPVEPDVIKPTNSLELIALCCEGRMLDPAIIYRTFSDGFITIYDRIAAVPSLKSRGGMSGRDLLKENPATMLFYDHLMERRKNRDRITN